MENGIRLPQILNFGVYDSTANPKLRYCSVTPERSVKNFEIDFPTEEGGKAFINGEEFSIRPERIFIAKPGQIRYTFLPYKCKYIHLRAENSLYERIYNLPVEIKLSDIKRANQLYRDIIQISSNRLTDDELLLQSRVLELIWLLESEHRRNLCEIPKNESIASALRYIDGHTDRNITLDELAESQHLSPVYFHKLFKKSLGITPYNYILEKKLAIAKNELIMTNKSCLDIALGLGFSSQSYFNYTFRKKIGQSPLQFRKEQNSRYPD